MFDSKEPTGMFGPHDFSSASEGGSDECKYGCGCRSSKAFGSDGGPKNLDPNGECPNNPIPPKIGNNNESIKQKPDDSKTND